MSLQLPFGVRVLNPLPVEDKYLNNGVPYTGTSQVNSLIASGVRYTGLTVNINGVEYWYNAGISNGSLVVKTSSGGGTLTGATNGLSVKGKNVVLGGALTGTTIVNTNTHNLAISGNGQTHIDNGGGVYIGENSGGGVYFDDHGAGGVYFNDFGGGGVYFNDHGGGGIYLKDIGAGGIFIGDTNQTGGGLNLSQRNAAISMTVLDAADNSRYDFRLQPASKAIFHDFRTGNTAAGIEYAADYSSSFLKYSLVDKNYVTGLTSSSGVQSANNGLTKSGSNVHLGGSLTGNTTVSGGSSYNFSLNAKGVNIDEHGSGINITEHNGGGIFLQSNGGGLFLQDTNNGGIYIQGSSNTSGGIYLGRTIWNNGGIYLTDRNTIEFNTLNASGTSLFDFRIQGGSTVNPTTVFSDSTATPHGIQYNADYSATYTSRSLVDKAYTDSIAAGLQPKAAVFVATTAALTGATYHATGGTMHTGSFTSAPIVVDGRTLSVNNRILVKNQTDARQNGIYYVISGGTWYRSVDMDGTPANEVGAGDFTFVQTGTTNVGTGWVVIGSGSTLTLNVSPINWVQFSAPASVTASNGLTKVINDIQLGGTLSSNVQITNGANNFRVRGTTGEIELRNTSSGFINIETNGGGIQLTDDANHGFIGIDASSLGGQAQFFGYNSALILGSGATTFGGMGKLSFLGDFFIEDQRALFNGIQYAGDYSSRYTLRSLVDKHYVTGVTSSSGVQTANNGLTKSGTNVHLGGKLTGDTTISASANTLNISTQGINLTDTNGGINIQGANGGINIWQTSGGGINIGKPSFHNGGIVLTDRDFIELNLKNSTGTTKIDFVFDAVSGAIFTDSRTTPHGIQYLNNYSAGFTKFSLVDKNYVTGLTTTSGIQTANNGLTKSSSNVHLGGALTGNTNVSMSTNTLTLTGTSSAALISMTNVNSRFGYQISGTTLFAAGHNDITSIQIGSGANVSGSTAIGIGQNVIATGNVAIAIGQSALASQQGNIAIGTSANASGSTNSIAIGSSTRSSGNQTTAVGNAARATGFGASAFGVGAYAIGNDSVAVGETANAAGASGIAIGVSSKSNANSSIAIGASAGNTTGTDNGNAVSIGRYSNQGIANIGTSSVAIGDNSHSTGTTSIAIGAGSAAYAINTISIGGSALSNSQYGIAIGTSAIVSGGTSGSNNPIAIGLLTNAFGDYSIAIGQSAKATNTSQNGSAIAIGDRSLSKEAGSIAIGSFAGHTSGTDHGFAVSIGRNANQGSYDIGNYGVAIGGLSNSKGTQDISIGINAGNTSGSSGGNAISFGVNSNQGTTNIGANSIAIGYGTLSTGSSAIAIGASASAGGANSIVIGNSSSTIFDNDVVIGGNIIDTAGNTSFPSVIIGKGAVGHHLASTIIGAAANATGAYESTLVGYGANSIGDQATVLGVLSSASGNAIALGRQTTASGTMAIAIGNTAVSKGGASISIGSLAGSTSGTDNGTSISIGSGANYDLLSTGINIGQYSIAMGRLACAPAQGAIVMGYGTGVPQSLTNSVNDSFGLGWNNSTPDYQLTKGILTTNNATQQTLLAYTLATGTTYSVRAIVTARESVSGASRAMFVVKVLAYRESSGAVIEGSVPYQIEKVQSTNAATWDATATVSGNNLQISVTGTATQTIHWKVILETSNVH